MATIVKEIAFADFRREREMTRTSLERIPDDRLSWRPHPKSYTIGGLGTHIANLPTWILSGLTDDGFDFANRPPNLQPLESVAAIVAKFEENMAVVDKAFAEIDDDGLAETWTLRHGEHVISAEPRSTVFRQWGISHIVHHRAQLSVYLRLLDIPVPAIYGPSADAASDSR